MSRVEPAERKVIRNLHIPGVDSDPFAFTFRKKKEKMRERGEGEVGFCSNGTDIQICFLLSLVNTTPLREFSNVLSMASCDGYKTIADGEKAILPTFYLACTLCCSAFGCFVEGLRFSKNSRSDNYLRR